MSSKFERDVVGAGSLIAEIFGGQNPAIREAAEHVRRKVGVGMPGGDDANGAPEDDGKRYVDVVGSVGEDGTFTPEGEAPRARSESAGPFFFCVYAQSGAYTGRSFTNPSKAAEYADSLPGAAYVKKIGAGDLPEG